MGPVLVVEDSDEDFMALEWAMRKLGRTDRVLRCLDGDDALDALFGRGPYTEAVWPSLVLLDLNLPGTDGREVLAELKATPTLRRVPVVVLSTSSNPRDVAACYQSGVNSYMLKPVNFEKYTEQLGRLFEFWLGVAVLPEAPVEA
ncbi:two-component system response regulator [Deinococcus aquiradiocola]|uniref:Two-component system response regulator n=1 Tax=Deinococcus aquiradiocola TaxID=393059 RepID=A0A917PC52_9DEIO|nr:two-component system response regulator [Deinococcus aquiradiocola]